jgi:hypothetical protein
MQADSRSCARPPGPPRERERGTGAGQSSGYHRRTDPAVGLGLQALREVPIRHGGGRKRRHRAAHRQPRSGSLAGIPSPRPPFRECLKIVVSPVRVRVSPSPVRNPASLRDFLCVGAAVLPLASSCRRIVCLSTRTITGSPANPVARQVRCALGFRDPDTVVSNCVS